MSTVRERRAAVESRAAAQDVIIRVDLGSMKSIKAGEIKKARLENSGHILVNLKSSFTWAEMTYRPANKIGE